jgi:hypothetical protein
MRGATCTEGDHYAPDEFDGLDTAYCPRCGLTIRWNEDTEIWDEDDTLTVIVLEEHEVAAIRAVLDIFKLREITHG